MDDDRDEFSLRELEEIINEHHRKRAGDEAKAA